MDETPRALGSRSAAVPAAGPGTALADVRPRLTSSDRGGSPSAADAVLLQTSAHWRFEPRSFLSGRAVGSVPVPRSGWLSCGFCGSTSVVLRSWGFHTRPGRPTVPRRCDVDMKCGSCAAGWWHGVAISEADWNARPRPVGLRAALVAGSNFEPKLWAGDRRG